MSRRLGLSGRRRFAAVRAERISAGSGALRVHLAPNELEHVRIGLVVPRAVGGAVVRNAVRRRLRAALQPRHAELAGLDVVVTVSPPGAAATFAQLDADLGRCLDRALRFRQGETPPISLARSRMRRRSDGAPSPQLTENDAVRPGPRRALAPTPV